MKCPVCNKDNGAGLSFCEGCGRKIPRCPTCGVELTCRDRFCSNDGTRLSDDLLLLVPEETVLQEPVWSQPAAPAAAPEEALPLPEFPDPWEAQASEETVRVTAVSGGRGWQSAPPVRNSDPVSVPAFDSVEVRTPPQPPQRAFCENCGKRVAPGNRYCSDCQRTMAEERSGSSEKSGKMGKIILTVILVILLLLGLFAGGYAIVNSDLFDWDSTSSNREEKEKDEEEEETEDTSVPTADSEDPVTPADGVEDPVNTTPAEDTTAPVDVTDPVVETTAPPTEPEVTPLMYWIENCDKMYLTEEDLEGFDEKMCVYARNACYAKSGRKFNSAELQEYFAQFDWYNPTVSPNNFTDSMLNSYQVANINLILAYERAHGYN